MRVSRRTRWVALVVVVQLALVGVAVWPRLSARLTGTEYRFRVTTVDPFEPLRGSYVALRYPDLGVGRTPTTGFSSEPVDRRVYLPIVRGADGISTAGTALARRPAHGPYLACRDRGWEVRCGIESWFVSSGRAGAFQQAARSGTAVALVRVDARGNAALVSVSVTGSR